MWVLKYSGSSVCPRNVALKRVLYVPEMAHCLISARMLAADGYEMTTGKGAIFNKNCL